MNSRCSLDVLQMFFRCYFDVLQMNSRCSSDLLDVDCVCDSLKVQDHEKIKVLRGSPPSPGVLHLLPHLLPVSS